MSLPSTSTACYTPLLTLNTSPYRSPQTLSSAITILSLIHLSFHSVSLLECVCTREAEGVIILPQLENWTENTKYKTFQKSDKSSFQADSPEEGKQIKVNQDSPHLCAQGNSPAALQGWRPEITSATRAAGVRI